MKEAFEAERAVLAAALNDKRDAATVVSSLCPEDFGDWGHEIVARAIWDVVADGGEVSTVTVSQRLKSDDRLKAVGGSVLYIEDIADSFAAIGLDDHMKIVRDAARARKIHDAALAAYQTLDEGGDVDVVLGRLQERLQDAITPLGGGPEDANIVAEREAQNVLRRERGDHESAGVQTGFRQLDHILGGLGRGSVYVVAGGTSTGKSSLADQIAAHVAKRGKRVAVFALEMTREQRIRRWIAREYNISLEQLESAYLSPSARRVLSEGFRLFADGHIYLDDSRGITTLDIRARSRNLQLGGGLGLIVVDYLQLLEPVGHGRSREQEVASMSTEISRIAGDLDVPVLLLSQLNRASESDGRAPELRDLRESGRIEQDAHAVLMIERPDRSQPLAKLYVRKNRQGRLGEIRMNFTGHYSRFDEEEAV